MMLAQAVIAAWLFAAPDGGSNLPHGGFDPDRCPLKLQLRALGSVSSARHTWKALHVHFQEYGRCDAGPIAEGYSDDVVYLLAHKWKLIGDLASLARADPPFLPFVVTHIDPTAATEDLETVVGNAQDACPHRHAELCRRIAEQAKSALGRQKAVEPK